MNLLEKILGYNRTTVQDIENFFTSIPSVPLKIVIIVGCAIFAQAFLRMILSRSTNFITNRDIYKNADERHKRVKTINSLITAIVSTIVWSLAVIMILALLGVPIAPIVASAGLIAAIFAFGSQSIIKDFVSGLFIIAEDQYHIDDHVEINNVKGTVESVSVRTTCLRSEDGSVIYIPNGSITTTSNKSNRVFTDNVLVKISNKTKLDVFAKELTAIHDRIQAEPSTAMLISSGPSIGAIVEVTNETTTVYIEFKTTASKRKDATSAIWRAIAESSSKKKITLA